MPVTPTLSRQSSGRSPVSSLSDSDEQPSSGTVPSYGGGFVSPLSARDDLPSSSPPAQPRDTARSSAPKPNQRRRSSSASRPACSGKTPGLGKLTMVQTKSGYEWGIPEKSADVQSPNKFAQKDPATDDHSQSLAGSSKGGKSGNTDQPRKASEATSKPLRLAKVFGFGGGGGSSKAAPSTGGPSRGGKAADEGGGDAPFAQF